MNHPLNIRKYYSPIQPSLKPSDTDVSYREITPDHRLINFIYCYWELRTNSPLSEDFIYRVVADGCIDIFFEVNTPQESFVMGFSKQYTEFPLGQQFHYFGIRFFPSIFPQLFGINAAELTDKYELLANVVPDVSKFIATELGDQYQNGETPKILDNYFLRLLNNCKINFDNRFYEALDTILINGGTVAIESELNSGISSRQLRRLFDFYIGTTAKTFSKIIRFQTILQARPSVQSLRKNKIFFDSGYYDQAHFIKEFKTLSGLTPSKAFEEK